MNRNVHVPFLGEGAAVTPFSLTRHFITTSTGKHYGTFHGKLRERQKRDREKRRRKAKLRRCLEKKGVKRLPSTRSKSGQRLARHVRQEINRAINQCFDEHPHAQFAHERLTVATMKYKARAMNAYLYASNLAHIPKQLTWNAAKRGDCRKKGQERLLLSRVQRLSLSRSSQQTRPANVLLCGLRLSDPRRSQRGHQHQSSLGRPRTQRLQR